MRTKLLNLKNDNNGTITLIPPSTKKAFSITLPQNNCIALTKEKLPIATNSTVGFFKFGIVNNTILLSLNN